MAILRDGYGHDGGKVNVASAVTPSEATMLADAYTNLTLAQDDLALCGRNLEQARERYYEYRAAYEKAKAIADDVLAQNMPVQALQPILGDTAVAEPSYIQRERAERDARERAVNGYR